MPASNQAGLVVSVRFRPVARVRAKVEFDRVFADGRRIAPISTTTSLAPPKWIASSRMRVR